MRSGWSADAGYVVFDTGPYGGPHGHEDKLSFELFAGRVPFIVDVGSYTYQPDDPYRSYFVGSDGHNTVVVDGQSQVRRWNSRHLTPRVEDCDFGQWYSDADVDRASGSYDEGYAQFQLTEPQAARRIDDVVHWREILFAKPDFWIIVDLLISETEHDFTTFFHLSPDVQIKQQSDDGALLCSERNGAQLAMRGFTRSGFRSDAIVGRERPPQGWYSADHHRKEPAFALAYSTSGSEQTLSAWIFVPIPPTSDSDKPRITAVSRDDETSIGMSVAITRPSGKYREEFNITASADDAESPISIQRSYPGSLPAFE